MVVRVPVGVLAEVQDLIRRHKESTLNHVQETKNTSCDGAAGSPAKRSESVLPPPSGPEQDLKAIRRQLERLPKEIVRKLRKDYGTLYEAAKAGVRADGHRAVYAPQ